MQVDIDDQLMENLLQSTVTGIGVPYSYIDATSEVEFARSLSMQNQGFVKKVVNFQELFGTYFTSIIRDMYEYEYGKTEHDKSRDRREALKKKDSKEDVGLTDESFSIDPTRIYIQFPEPVLLSVNTSNEQIEATSTTIDYITSLYIDEQEEGNKTRLFKRRLAQDVFLRNLDWDLYDQAFKETSKDIVKSEIDEEIVKDITGDDAAAEETDEDSYL